MNVSTIAANRIYQKTLVILGILGLMIGLFSRISILSRDEAKLTVTPIEDDSYYTQSYAWHISRGEWFSINSAQKSNAYHPLFPALASLMYSIPPASNTEGLPRVLCLQLIFFLVLCILLFKIMNKLTSYFRVHKSAAFFCVGIYACDANVWTADMNLMETGLRMLLFVTFVYAALPRFLENRYTFGQDFKESALLALQCLTRIDMLFMVFGWAFYLFFFQRMRSWKSLAILVFPSVAAVLGWMMLSYIHTGWLIPSGGAPFIEITGRTFFGNLQKSFFILIHFFLGIPGPHHTFFWWTDQWGFVSPVIRRGIMVVLCVTVIIWGYLYRSKVRTDEGGRLDQVMPILRAFYLSGLCVCLVYVVMMSASYFFTRYFSFLLPLRAVTIALLLFASNSEYKIHKLRWVFLAVFMAAHLSIFGYHQWRISKVQTTDWAEAKKYIESNPWENKTIASFESGVLGFYLPHIINLDGKTNADAFHAIRKGRLAEYILTIRPDYILDISGKNITEYLYRSDKPIQQNPDFEKQYQLVHNSNPYIWKRR